MVVSLVIWSDDDVLAQRHVRLSDRQPQKENYVITKASYVKVACCVIKMSLSNIVHESSVKVVSLSPSFCSQDSRSKSTKIFYITPLPRACVLADPTRLLRPSLKK